MKKNTPHLTHPESEASFFSGMGVAFILFCIVVIAGVIYAINRDTPAQKKPQANSGTIYNLPDTPKSPTADLERIHYSAVRNIQGEGSLTFIEYSDMTCEFCKRYHTTVSEILNQYSGEIAYSYQHLPLENKNSGTQAALAAECAGEQKQYHAFIEKTFTATISEENVDKKLTTIAKTLDLDIEEFETCVATKKYNDRVADDSLQGLATGATGAPWSILVDHEGKILMRFKGAIGKKRLNEALTLALKDQKKK